jgi:hypothetical protein
MTVSSTSNRVVYQGNGTTTVFPFAFKVQQAADLVVVYTDTTGTDFTLSPSQYTASGFGLDAGGSVTYPASGGPITSGTTLTIYRDMAPTQPTSISNQGAMWPQVIEGALDRLTFIVQKIADVASRSLTISATDGGSLDPLPNRVLRANSYLSFDGNGQPIATQNLSLASVSSWLANNFLTQTTAAAALSALGGITTSVLTTTGDLFVRGASTVGRLGIGGTGQVLTVVGGTAAWATPVLPAGHIQGLTYANNVSNPGRDIDIAAGMALDSTGAIFMPGPALTKKTDTAWAAGTNQGSLDTGTVGNNDYFVWLIGKTDLSQFDYLTSLSATAPTMPSGWTYKRLVNYVKRSGGSVVASKQYEVAGGGLDYYWAAPTTDILGQVLTATPVTVTPRVPTAFSVVGSYGIYTRGVADTAVLYNPDVGFNNAASGQPIYSGSAGADGTAFMTVRSNAAGQLKAVSRTSTPTIDLTTISFQWARR